MSFFFSSYTVNRIYYTSIFFLIRTSSTSTPQLTGRQKVKGRKSSKKAHWCERKLCK